MKAKALLLCLVFALVVSASASQVEIITVYALSSSTLTVNLSGGQKFTGSISISGGSGDDVDFSVTNPVGTTIVSLGRVSHGVSFDFTADQSGGYILHFGNSFSLLSTKNVTLSYDVSNPGLFNLLLWIIVAIIAFGILLGLVKWYQQKQKQKPPP